MVTSRLQAIPYAGLAVALSVIVYAPILQNYFWRDDFLILNLLTNLPLAEFLAIQWAGHLVIVRNAFFAVVDAVFGATPTPYYVVLLVLHGINVGLVFVIVHTVTRSAPLACLAAAAWGTCPINEGALGWIAASGNVMVATTTLAVLTDAVRAGWHGSRVRVGRSVLWAVFLLAGAQSFGTGLGVALAAPVVLMWLAWERLTWAARGVLLSVPLVTTWMYGADHSQFTGHLASSALGKAGMLYHLQAVGVTTVLQGLVYEPSPYDFVAFVTNEPLPASGPSQATYVVALLVVCLWAFVAVWIARGRTQGLLIAVGVLVLANYGAIAIGRAYVGELFNQSVVRWATQARYHYSATALLAIGLAVLVAILLGDRLAAWGRAMLIVWLAVFAALYARTGWTIRHYDAERQRAERILARIDAAIRATPAGEPVVTYNEPFWDGPHMDGAASLYVMTRDADHPEVYFVDRRAAAVARAFPGGPLAHAMLPPPPPTGRTCESRLALQSAAAGALQGVR